MGLPHRRQNLAKYIVFRGLTADAVATHLGITRNGVYNLSHGNRYPSPTELAQLEELLDAQRDELFEAELLRYAESWPPQGSGFRTAARS